MLKFVVYFVIAAVVVIAAASVWHLMRVAAGNKEEMSRYAGPEKEFTGHFGKALVVYYSLDGHTREIAEKIREKTGADIYEIKTREKFKKTPWFYLTLKKQLKNGEYPELAGELPDPKAYDVVFVGAPVWWYTMATPLFSYLKQTESWFLFPLRAAITAAFLPILLKKQKMRKLIPRPPSTICRKVMNGKLTTKLSVG